MNIIERYNNLQVGEVQHLYELLSIGLMYLHLPGLVAFPAAARSIFIHVNVAKKIVYVLCLLCSVLNARKRCKARLHICGNMVNK